MKNGMVYANGNLVDRIRVRDDYTLDDYCDECKINGCAWEGNLHIEWHSDEEVEQISPADRAADDTVDYERVLHELIERLAARLVDRAIQQTVDADELRARVGDLIDPEIVDMACEIVAGEIVDDFFMMQDDETEDFLDFLMSNKSVWEAFPGQEVES